MNDQIRQNPDIPAWIFAIMAGVIVLMCTVDAVRCRRYFATYQFHYSYWPQFWAGIMMLLALALAYTLHTQQAWVTACGLVVWLALWASIFFCPKKGAHGFEASRQRNGKKPGNETVRS